MDTQSLRTASTYINNLLLSRGLLRNGVPIEFACPANAEGGVDATMGKVMNLVHDLILRRDVCRAKHGQHGARVANIQLLPARSRHPLKPLSESPDLTNILSGTDTYDFPSGNTKCRTGPTTSPHQCPRARRTSNAENRGNQDKSIEGRDGKAERDCRADQRAMRG